MNCDKREKKKKHSINMEKVSNTCQIIFTDLLGQLENKPINLLVEPVPSMSLTYSVSLMLSCVSVWLVSLSCLRSSLSCRISCRKYAVSDEPGGHIFLVYAICNFVTQFYTPTTNCKPVTLRKIVFSFSQWSPNLIFPFG